ncbi:MAG: hypothetical protein AAF447_11720 [Myxococcota bacterium]
MANNAETTEEETGTPLEGAADAAEAVTDAAEAATEAAEGAAEAATDAVTDAAEDAADAASDLAEDAGEAAHDALEEAAGATSVAAEAAAETAAAAEAAADKPGARMKKTGRKKKAPRQTAGERLAAQKAAKAAKKREERHQEAEDIEDKAIERAEEVTSWLDKNKRVLGIASAAIVLLAAVALTVRGVSRGAGADATGALWEATQTATAPIVPEGEDVPEGIDESYPTLTARAEAARPKLEAVARDFVETDAAVNAQLALGALELDAGNPAEARAAFEAAYRAGGDDARVASRALEGIAFSHEAQGQWDEAASRYGELAGLSGAGSSIVADYHRARAALAGGDEPAAKEKLQAVLDALREEDAPELPYVKDQAELRLMAIDSTLVDRDPSSDIDPALLQQLMRQQQAAGGGG